MKQRARKGSARRSTKASRLTPDLRDLLVALEQFFQARDGQGRRPAGATCGIYAFYDYEDEPIYVGQTYEGLQKRIRRHLTNRRTDAVAMKVLDPYEVARIEVWPFFELDPGDAQTKDILNRAEYTVFQQLSANARISALLNEVSPPPAELVELPTPTTGSVVPLALRERLGHDDERIARRASTIAALAQIIKERDVSIGLRRTLLTQAERLKFLADRRLREVTGETPPAELIEETVGLDDDR